MTSSRPAGRRPHGTRQAASSPLVDLRLRPGGLVPTGHVAAGALMDAGSGDDPLAWVRREVPPRFERRVITIAPGGEHPYDEVEWRGAIVVVARGAVELEGAGGVRHVLARPAVLWLAGLPLRALHNPGTGTAVLVAVRRR